MEQEDGMNVVDFVASVRRMRAAQKQYFKTKDYASLCEAKKLEAEVDKMLKSVEPDEQLKLDF